MAFSVPSNPPERMTVGATVKFTVSLADFLPTDGWVFTATLIKTGAQHTFTATDNGDGTHLVTIPSTGTPSAANFTPGSHRLIGIVEKASPAERYALNGQPGLPLFEWDVEVLADPAAEAGGYDFRTVAQKMVDALEGILATHEAGAGHTAAYSMPDGRSLSFNSAADVIVKLSYWRGRRKREIERENRKRGRGPTGSIKANLR